MLDGNLLELDPPANYQGRLLGFDFGLRHIGIAVGQTVTKNATPLLSITANEGEPKSWLEIDKLITQWKPKACIVGIPLNMDGTPQTVTMPARHFAQTLKQRYNLPVHGVDERLTTKDAKARLFDAGGYKALSKQAIDALSAAIILESWLNQYSED